MLWRRNRDMAITVRADVKDGEQGVSATQSIVPQLKDIEAKLPSGYRIDVGGAVEESDKANPADGRRAGHEATRRWPRCFP